MVVVSFPFAGRTLEVIRKVLFAKYYMLLTKDFFNFYRFRILILQSTWVRFQLTNLRMSRYFDAREDLDAIKAFFNNSSHGDWYPHRGYYSESMLLLSPGSSCTR